MSINGCDEGSEKYNKTHENESKDVRQIRRHFAYISRKERMAIVTEEGRGKTDDGDRMGHKF